MAACPSLTQLNCSLLSIVHIKSLLHCYNSRDSLVSQIVKSLPATRETWVPPRVGNIPWRRRWQPNPVFLPGKSHGQRNLAGYSLGGHKQSDTTEQLHFHFSIIIHRFPSFKLFFYPEYSFNSFDLLGFYLLFST